jgi:polar amino acid transport system permease protein
VPLTLVGLIYLLLTLVATTVVRLLERRLPRHGVLLK